MAYFDTSVRFLVQRETLHGYETVPYDLADPTRSGTIPSWASWAYKDGRVHNPAQLILKDAKPGHYVVSWPANECIVRESTTEVEKVVGEFTMTEAAELPTELGTLSVRDLGLIDVTRNLGVGADCQPETQIATLDRKALDLTLPDQWAPWAGVLDIAVYVDGAVYRGWHRASLDGGTEGIYTEFIDYVCATFSDQERQHRSHKAPRNRLSPGTHHVKLAGRVVDGPELFSNDATFSVSCPEQNAADTASITPTPESTDHESTAQRDQADGGCAIGRSDPPALLWLMLGALALFSVVTRSRRRCPLLPS